MTHGASVMCVEMRAVSPSPSVRLSCTDPRHTVAAAPADANKPSTSAPSFGLPSTTPGEPLAHTWYWPRGGLVLCAVGDPPSCPCARTPPPDPAPKQLDAEALAVHLGARLSPCRLETPCTITRLTRPVVHQPALYRKV